MVEPLPRGQHDLERIAVQRNHWRETSMVNYAA
jgi:hypothetical protein